MSRQPRKVFGFTGGAKYGPVADGEEDVKDPLVAPASGEMDRKKNKNKNNSTVTSPGACEPDGWFCVALDSILCCCKIQDCL